MLQKLCFIFLLITGVQIENLQAQTVTVSYIANEGIVIQEVSSGIHILVDTYFDGFYPQYDFPSDSILSLIYENQPPFKGPRIALVTHQHADHFNADLLSKDLANKNMKMVVLPEQAAALINSALLNDNVNTVHESSAEFSLDEDINIKCYFIEHINPRFKEIANVAFLITIFGKKILHLGDAYINEGNLQEIENQKIDLVVLPYFVLDQNALEILNEKFEQPKIAPIHFDKKSKSAQIEKINSIPNSIVFPGPLIPIKL